MYSSKSNIKSAALRSEGNKYYSDRNFFNALVKYNESLCYAEVESENMGLAFANRSAIYFELKLLEKCLANIELARANHYPNDNLVILEKREAKCNDFIRNQKEKKSLDPFGFFKLSYPPHKNLPFIADCLEVKINEKYGRHVITNRDLKVGDIVAVEKPFCSILLAKSTLFEISESNIYQRCLSCLKENSLDLIPCSTCCKGS